MGGPSGADRWRPEREHISPLLRIESKVGCMKAEMENPEKKLREDGLVLVKTVIAADRTETLRCTLFENGKAGTRCLLDVPCVAEAVGVVRGGLSAIGLLPKTAVAIQAIAFDKTPD